MLGGLIFAFPNVRVFALTPTHLDGFKVKFTCAACHSGHGKRGTPMLRKTVPALCYDCHGPEGYAYFSTSNDVYYDFQKRYRHPVEETARYHKQTEILPEKDRLVERHTSCLDCHNPHVSTPSEPNAGVPGESLNQFRQKSAENISDICIKCHADNLNRPASSPDVKEEFDTANQSFHPVLGVSRGRSISVLPELQGKTIGCTDCHEPHGSDYEDMLRYNYSKSDGAETAFTYELCYQCHRRDLVIGDQGFSEHRRHVVFENASCRACHVAHGSKENERLIGFDPLVVTPNSKGMLLYERVGTENRCFLSCHGADHNGKTVQRN
ncbi:MAG: hypothetical protein D6726_01955 [Nitrospirae bacterium]|nr:MAG: hypothetical protein D6726_01955 [Nitrospirota bacterium]